MYIWYIVFGLFGTSYSKNTMTKSDNNTYLQSFYKFSLKFHYPFARERSVVQSHSAAPLNFYLKPLGLIC